MDKTETLTNPNTKSPLQELLTRNRPAVPRSTLHRRRTDSDFEITSSTESHTLTSNATGDTLYRTTGSGVVLEPVSRKPYDLSYSCLLIPRFTAHYLIGDIAEDLHEWMRQICVAFEWRLEALLVRPEYMQWVLYVPAATPPSRCIRTVREQSSRRIFEEFPHIRRENISKDFWAPGYLVLMGPTPHPPEMINEYIRLTRQQQGIQPRLRD